MHSNFPGACSLEFESIMQVVIEHLFGWNIKKQMSKGRGIFGVAEAFGGSTEEQNRATLHEHMIVHVRNFHKLRQLLFSVDDAEQLAAREELKKYVTLVMCATFGDSTEVEGGSVFDVQSSSDPVDVIVSDGCTEGHHDLSPLPFQILREQRHKAYCNTHKGLVGICDRCSALVSSVDIVNAALNQWKLFVEERHNWGDFPLCPERMDVVAMRYPYDLNQFPEGSVELRMRGVLVKQHFNEHDWAHHPGCFKNGLECRFDLPQYSTLGTAIVFDEQKVRWYCLSPVDQWISSFKVYNKRHLSDLFLNCHNPVISGLFGYNSNVQLGDVGHIFYNTMYGSKSNQEEETREFIDVTNALDRRIKKQLMEATENEGDEYHDQYIEGLSRILGGIRAHVSETVVSSTLAHAIMLRGGSRFRFSHDFQPLMLSQAEDHFDGKDISIRIRSTNKSRWLDAFINDYIYRNGELEETCMYEMCMWYEHKELRRSKGRSPVDEGADEERDFVGTQNVVDDDERNIFDYGILVFTEGHPGRKHIGLKRRKNFVVPILYHAGFCSLSLLNMENLNVLVEEEKHAIFEQREVYARKALLLFACYRNIVELKDSTDGTYWTSFLRATNDGSFWKKGLEILQNIQDIHTIKQLKKSGDIVMLNTDCPQDSPDVANSSNLSHPDEIESHLQVHEDTDMSSLWEDFNLLGGSDDHRTTSIISTAKFPELSLAKLDIIEESIFNEPVPYNLIADGVEVPTGLALDNHFSTIEIIFRLLQGGLAPLTIVPGDINSPICALKQIGQLATLDKKQEAAYGIICSCFIRYCFNHNLDTIVVNNDRVELERQLDELGPKDQLIMFLSGLAGGGKSHVVNTCQQFCKLFCDSCGIPFDENTFMLTACTGAAAAAFQNGRTIHSVAGLNRKKISQELKDIWVLTNTLVIDEVSFFSKEDFFNLDKVLKQLAGDNGRHKLYGGFNIVFCGDLFQMHPVKKKPVFKEYSVHWHGMVNAAVFLDVPHRFRDDPEWGELLANWRFGRITPTMIDVINARLVCADLPIPSGKVTCYACPTNKERNIINTSIFEQVLHKTHPSVMDEQDPPNHTIVIECHLTHKGVSFPEKASTFIGNNCGDACVQTSQNKRIDPSLKLCNGMQIMINSNDEIGHGLANGTLAIFRGMQLKEGVQKRWKFWDSFKVWTVSVQNVECIYIQHWKTKRIHKLTPCDDSVSIEVTKIDGQKINYHGVNIRQFGILCNNATTGHKLQGMSKDVLVVNNWDYRCPNWIYVVLSRVHTIQGLFLLKRLRVDHEFHADKDLLKEDQRLHELETKTLSLLPWYH